MRVFVFLKRYFCHLSVLRSYLEALVTHDGMHDAAVFAFNTTAEEYVKTYGY